MIPTLSSRPHHHPRELPVDLVKTIIAYREKYRRCAEVIHWHLEKDGYIVSLSSVKQTLKRNHLTYPSPWKKWHHYTPRPVPESPGKLVQIDTIMDGAPEDRIYIYTLLDVCCRWAYAEPSLYVRAGRSALILKHAQHASPFVFATIQSDHGSEFSKYFKKKAIEMGMEHRHSRVRTPTDNAHLERFNRTIQDECLCHIPRRLSVYQKEIPEFIRYYNYERPHMSLGMQTPMEVLRSY
ncbi:hypothetical protein A2755_00525 [Candidatus Wolfebacteria bacterium RIFCSPHIGHO2_01_FULL_48_22]|uniref:Integrase catalytic domain-containing protein n=2 Tax=Candidatus Wolfeibacteriota TaxID=1752735 RepID=A0A1F8DVE4_9BACT|nr:MAG: hypothetical protein A2755_00525 [Candidatus Wolfebacteria bacterium RIFCSPHIGHO2_01_FULL_48_22]OGM92648.1 MAG: hypothetical protein A2935_03990 [Candidatus Wolfebacteria bacterium RIFCSPLOWO2_01_FULL_47_17b]